jgi:glutamyl/glutaminyl-tRNA synthetase
MELFCNKRIKNISDSQKSYLGSLFWTTMPRRQRYHLPLHPQPLREILMSGKIYFCFCSSLAFRCRVKASTLFCGPFDGMWSGQDHEMEAKPVVVGNAKS